MSTIISYLCDSIMQDDIYKAIVSPGGSATFSVERYVGGNKKCLNCCS